MSKIELTSREFVELLVYLPELEKQKGKRIEDLGLAECEYSEWRDRECAGNLEVASANLIRIEGLIKSVQIALKLEVGEK